MEAEDFLAQQQERFRRNQRQEELFGNYRKGIVPQPNVLWHDNLDEIDFSLQRDTLHPKLHDEGLTVLKQVNVELCLTTWELLTGQCTEKNNCTMQRKIK